MASPPGPPAARYGRDFGDILRRYLVRNRTEFRLVESIQPVAIWDDCTDTIKGIPPSMGVAGGTITPAAGTACAFVMACNVDTVIIRFNGNNCMLFPDPLNTLALPIAITGIPQLFAQVGHSGAVLQNTIVTGQFPAPQSGGFMQGQGAGQSPSGGRWDRWFIPAGGKLWLSDQAVTSVQTWGLQWSEAVGTGQP